MSVDLPCFITKLIHAIHCIPSMGECRYLKENNMTQEMKNATVFQKYDWRYIAATEDTRCGFLLGADPMIQYVTLEQQ